MICRMCEKKLSTQYEHDWIQLSEHHTWATPDGQCGSMIPYSAVFCSYKCALAAVADLAIKKEANR